MSWRLCIFVLLLVGCAGQSPDSGIRFPTLRMPGQIAPAATLTAAIYKPSGAGPFPAVVVLHHCAGIDGDLHAWARRLASEGYVTIVPDSFGPRGFGSVCTTGAVTLRDRVPDAYAAADYLRSLPDVKGDRIGLIGFSHGAGTIAQVAVLPPPSAPFRAGVAFYPNCRAEAPPPQMPTLVLIGEKDDWTPAAPCEAWGRHVGDTAKLDVVVYPGAYHKFDGHANRDVPGTGGSSHHLQPDPGATQDANARAEAFLDRWLKR
jgi:dienelactone hydrolase